MTKADLKIEVGTFRVRPMMMAVAMGLVMVSCGSGGSKQQSSAETAVTKNEVSPSAANDPNVADDGKWKFPKDAPLSVPEKGVIQNTLGKLDEDKEWYGTMKWTIDDAKEYAKVAAKSGFTVNAKEVHNTEQGFYWYRAKNSAGTEVYITANNDAHNGSITITLKK